MGEAPRSTSCTALRSCAALRTEGEIGVSKAQPYSLPLAHTTRPRDTGLRQLDVDGLADLQIDAALHQHPAFREIVDHHRHLHAGCQRTLRFQEQAAALRARLNTLLVAPGTVFGEIFFKMCRYGHGAFSTRIAT
ncbi:hypothetical protein [Novosphingobium sp. ST904]|uniref:hypothetical protein n=1 Tax=Novosphingobium sp. ST904 TaxID=1684385 RepID=UPI001E5E1281|nr:hypothetical protein [Novosphingobium sp. ST904]